VVFTDRKGTKELLLMAQDALPRRILKVGWFESGDQGRVC